MVYLWSAFVSETTLRPSRTPPVEEILTTRFPTGRPPVAARPVARGGTIIRWWRAIAVGCATVAAVMPTIWIWWRTVVAIRIVLVRRWRPIAVCAIVGAIRRRRRRRLPPRRALT